MRQRIAELKQNIAVVTAKQHIQKYKNVYIAASSGLVVGVLLRGRTIPIATIKTTTILPWKSTVTHNITQTTTLIRRGHPGYIIKCLETGELFASQSRAAEVMNISAANLSQHLNGKYVHAGGYTFERLGEAVAPTIA